MNCPIVFYDMKKTNQGFYEVDLDVLVDNPRETEEGEITKKFIKRLEKQIKRRPEHWLWTHRRWKHKR